MEWQTYGKNTRLDHLLRNSRFPGSEYWSKAAWNEALDRGWVHLSGKKEKSGGFIVPDGVEVKVILPEGIHSRPGPGSTTAEPLMAYEDFLFFSKRSGEHTVAQFPWERDCLVHRVARWFEEQGLVDFFSLAEPPLMEGGLLQRLDFETSGLVTVARTAQGKKKGRALFSGAATKAYLCVTPPLAKRTIAFFLCGEGPKRMARWQKKNEDDAFGELLVEPMQQSKEGHLQLTKVTAKAGQRHIVRAGMALAGAPLWGDRLYGSEGGGGFLLHGSAIEFPGFRGKDPLPPNFLARLEELKIEFKNED